MKIQDIILIILTLIAVGTAIWYLFGNSPTFEQAILVLMLGLLIANISKINVLESRFNLLEKSFCALAKDFKQYIH